MFIGIDFGTSNSSAAVYNGKEVRYIPLDPLNTEDIYVLSSLLYIFHIGGVPVGGSDFDKSLMFEKIAPLFGRGTRLEDGRTVPTSIYLELLEWQTIVN